ncbi:NADH-quinone oxidoreductase subunit M [Kordiimonas sediminis]|uniref:NADH-quinone oxidoreductase subunit M n=1 Tax=Kordiimonas sediminis TaxID=1735581 RepID=A0A919AWK4_9PROT|nr:NADH-quinone oxidoreductase subunit M [Kordiimonas sediminis]GHF28635.1 NADH-quinone oxidoreductase subunit M [Kordiimonas sediminis]
MTFLSEYLLSMMLAVPLVGAAIILLIRHQDQEIANRNIRNVAFLTTCVTFVLTILMWIGFDNSNPDFQFVESYSWFGDTVKYHLGVDGISMLFIVLTGFLMPIVIAASWESVQTRVKEYMIAFLVLETLMVGVFSALDIFLFYVFFEGGLIPMYLLIGIWGGVNRIYASFKFFLYTLLGSVLMLVAILWMVIETGTTDIPVLMTTDFAADVQNWLWLAFFASFAVKMPMWPVHTWLPDAHVQAPTGGSVILAGVLLKMGGYGFLRFSLPMFPEATEHFAWLVFALSIIAVIYTSLVALVQEDIKKLIAYSSVAHMGFVTIGIFVLNTNGIEGSIFQMLSHGVVSGALFLCVGVIYDRLHTREIGRYGGLAINMKIYAVTFVIFSMASVGLPGTSGFVGEFLVLNGAFQYDSWIAFGASFGVVLGAAYMLYLVRRVIFGDLTKDDVKAMPDLSWREKAIFAPLIAVVLWMGIYPKSFLDPIHTSVENLIETRFPEEAARQKQSVKAGAPVASSDDHSADAH